MLVDSGTGSGFESGGTLIVRAVVQRLGRKAANASTSPSTPTTNSSSSPSSSATGSTIASSMSSGFLRRTHRFRVLGMFDVGLSYFLYLICR